MILIFLGGLAMIWDYPFQLPQSLIPLKVGYHRFLLLTTRFVGRGLWYIWLGSLIWAALWDEDRHVAVRMFSIFNCAYTEILGIVAVIQGIMLSRKLNKVQELILASGRVASSFYPEGH